MSKVRSPAPIAFAAETNGDLVEVAKEKMTRKRSDLIYLNNVSGGAIFGSSKTSGSIIDKTGVIEELSNVSKENLAHTLINHAISKVDKLG
jgi:phosphopantothenoylcysteine decarboxylase/phosphopantothenate--cysteine ligase